MFDFKAMSGMVGASHLGSGCACLGGMKKAHAKPQLGTCQLLTVEERCELGREYEEYTMFPHDGEHITDGVKPKEKRDAVRNFISSSPVSTFPTFTDGSHGGIARGTMVCKVLYREAAEVYVGHRGRMTPDQKRLLDEAERIVDEYIRTQFNRAVKMMHDGNMTRDLLNPDNRDVLLQVIPTLQRRQIVNAFMDGLVTIHEMTRGSNLEPGSWIGWTKWAVDFATWVRDGELGYLDWGMYFHNDIEHTEEQQIRLGGMLGLCSAESQEAGNKEGRKIKRVKSRQNFNAHYDTVGARWLWCHRQLNDRWNAYLKKQTQTTGPTLLPATRLKRVVDL
jgi:hypothetical protein